MLTASFFWSLFGLLLAVASLIFLLKDLKSGRIYLILGSGEPYYDQKKVVISRERSPALFKLIIGGVVACTAITFVTCLIVLVVRIMSSIDFFQVAEHWQVILAFVPYSLILMYIFDNISIRVFARSWDL